MVSYLILTMIFDFFTVLCKCESILEASIIKIIWIYCCIFVEIQGDLILVDLILDEPFDTFSFSHLILKLLTNLKLNLLPSIYLSKSLYFFVIDLIISSTNTLESASYIIVSLFQTFPLQLFYPHHHIKKNMYYLKYVLP